jgi:GT2 family glycosyltransferase
MLVNREALESVGLMPECYFLYYEELDWSMSFTRAGYEIWYDPCLTVYHKESQSTGQDSPLRTYYITRNRLLFARRNLSLVTRWLTYAYLLSIVAARDLLRYALHRRADLAAGVVSGICDFIRGIQGQKRP